MSSRGVTVAMPVLTHRSMRALGPVRRLTTGLRPRASTRRNEAAWSHVKRRFAWLCTHRPPEGSSGLATSNVPQEERGQSNYQKSPVQQATWMKSRGDGNDGERTRRAGRTAASLQSGGDSVRVADSTRAQRWVRPVRGRTDHYVWCSGPRREGGGLEREPDCHPPHTVTRVQPRKGRQAPGGDARPATQEREPTCTP